MYNKTNKILKKIRKNIFLSAYATGIGHVASSLSLTEIFYSLYCNKIIDINKIINNEYDRDRIILSKGHGVLCLYSVLSYMGLINEDELFNIGNITSKIGGEPILSNKYYIEATAGSLGQAMTTSVGMAYSLKKKNIKSKVYVILGDGECQEGCVWEAINIAYAKKLNNLIIIIDDNKIQKMDFTEKIVGDIPLIKKLSSFGLQCFNVDGHNIDEIKEAILFDNKEEFPKAVICNTIKGKGISIMENKPEFHYRLPSKKYIKEIMNELDISEEEMIHAKSIYGHNI